jgi:hypothetical protein
VAWPSPLIARSAVTEICRTGCTYVTTIIFIPVFPAKQVMRVEKSRQNHGKTWEVGATGVLGDECAIAEVSQFWGGVLLAR